MSGKNKEIAYPYIPNALPHIRDRMLQRIGVKSIEELYEMIPERLRFKGKMDLPGPLHSEYELRRHVEAILQKNTSTAEVISFLGV